jgi:hypothetical protein
VPVNGDETLNGHYRWDSRKQRWALDGAEVAIVLGTVALFVSLLALALLFAR